MRALIIGCNGQDGTLLSSLLTQSGWDVAGTIENKSALSANHPLVNGNSTYLWNALDDSSFDFINDFEPKVIFYLAGITSVPESWKDPVKTFQVNTIAYTRLLTKLDNENKNIKVIYASSVEIFEDEIDISEDSPMSSSTPYGISKIAGTQIGRSFRKNGLWVANAILSNHESYLRSESFVTGKIAKSVASIQKGKTNKLVVGNIEIEKNWSAANDIVLGLIKIAELDSPNDFILAYSKNTKLKRLIEIAFNSIGINNWEEFIYIDETLFRKVENISKNYSTSLANEQLNWKADTPPEIWMKQMVDFHIAHHL